MKIVKRLRAMMGNRDNATVFWNIVGSVGIKGASMILNVCLLPAYMSYFSDQTVLGVWVTLVAAVTWILTFDLGVGNGLRNRLAVALVKRDLAAAKELISSAYVIIGALVVLFCVGGVLVARFLNWNSVLSVSPMLLSLTVLLRAVVVLLLAVLLNFWLKLVFSILYAMQQNAIPNLLSLISNVLILGFLLMNQGSTASVKLVNLALFYFGAINFPILLATVILFGTRLREARPNPAYWRKERAWDVLAFGSQFLFIQLSLMIINMTNEIIITRLLGPEKTVVYQVYYRIFYFVVTLFSIVTNPVWSAITKAHALQDLQRIRRLSRWLFAGAGLLSVLCLAIVPVFAWLQGVWLGIHAIQASTVDAMLFALFSTVMMFVLAESCVANGIGMIKLQMISFAVAAVVKVPLSLYAIHIYKYWISIVAANTVVLLPYVILQPFVLRRQLREPAAA